MKVYAPEPERTTVEQAWIAPGNPHQLVTEKNPDFPPHQYAVHFEIRLPLIQYVERVPQIVDTAVPDPIRRPFCSGTLVGDDSVLTAAHCMVGWESIGNGLDDKQPRIERVRAYSMTARPRRNGVGIAGVDDEVPDEIEVKRGLWNFASWPGPESEKTIYKQELDYGVAKLKERAQLPFASPRVIGTPQGKQIAAAHYPNSRLRGFEMYYSEGVVDEPASAGSNTYSHTAQAEVGSSGSGVFERNTSGVVAGVVGVQTSMRGPHIDIPAEKYDQEGLDQVYPVRLNSKFPNTAEGRAERAKEYRNRRYPNFALFFTNTTRDIVIGWIDAI